MWLSKCPVQYAAITGSRLEGATASEGCRGLVGEDGNEQVCQACNKRGVFKVFTDFADQGKLPNPGCGHAQRVWRGFVGAMWFRGSCWCRREVDF